MSESMMAVLARAPIVHSLIRLTGMQRAARSVLARWPIERRTPRSGLVYQVPTLESFMVANEIFREEIYGPAFDAGPVRTFVDLGANVGYFVVYAADRGGRDVVGIAIEANPDIVAKARWHVEKNELGNVHVIEGMAGHPPGVTHATLYLAGSNVSASAQPDFNPRLPLKGGVTTVDVPCVDALAEWKRVAGDARVDLMKMDVEGFEASAIANLPGLLDITDRLVVEWHKWKTTREALVEALAPHGLELDRVTNETVDAGIALFRRKSGR